MCLGRAPLGQAQGLEGVWVAVAAGTVATAGPDNPRIIRGRCRVVGIVGTTGSGNPRIISGR